MFRNHWKLWTHRAKGRLVTRRASRSTSFQINKREGWSFLFEALVAVVAIIGALVAYGQFRITQQQIDLTRQQIELARQSIEVPYRARVALVSIGVPNPIPKGEQFPTVLAFRNTGAVPALIKEGKVKLIFFWSGKRDAVLVTKDDTYKLEQMAMELPFSTNIIPQGADHRERVNIPPLNAADMKQVKEGRLRLFLQASILYDDGFGRMRRTEFCGTLVSENGNESDIPEEIRKDCNNVQE